MIELKHTRTAYNMYPDDLIFWKHDDTEYMLQYEADDMPQNPRALIDGTDDPDTICRMYCHHPRYNLGDYDNKLMPGSWLRLQIENTVPADMIADRLSAQAIPGYGPNDPDEDGAILTNRQDLIDRFLSGVEDGDVPISACRAMLKDYAVIMPLWLYDHSGITISVGDRVYPYNDRFDSGQVGWIFVSRGKIESIYGKPCPDWEAKAQAIIESEVKAYDQYLTGDIYAFSLYARPIPDDDAREYEEDDWDEIDACSGFYGTDILSNGVAEQIDRGLSEAIASSAYETGTHSTRSVVVHQYKKA